MSSTLQIAATDKGCILRVVGRGTMNESLVADEMAMRTLNGASASEVIFDLSACEYLDSTFLGCLVHLRKHFPDRFRVAAPPPVRKKLLGPLRLDLLIPSIDLAPEIRGQWVSVAIPSNDKRELLSHVMHSHEQLAQCGTPMQAIFEKIAAQMAEELKG